MGNVAIVDQSGVLRSPPYDGTILAGTTLLRGFAVAPQLVKVKRSCLFFLYSPLDTNI